jgi:hypothetical protein
MRDKTLKRTHDRLKRKSDGGEFKPLHRQQVGRDEAGFIRENLAISGLLCF